MHVWSSLDNQIAAPKFFHNISEKATNNTNKEFSFPMTTPQNIDHLNHPFGLSKMAILRMGLLGEMFDPPKTQSYLVTNPEHLSHQPNTITDQ